MILLARISHAALIITAPTRSMILPTPVVLQLKQGEDTTYTITCYSDNAVPPVDLVDLTGWTDPECTIRNLDTLFGSQELYNATVEAGTIGFASDRTTGQVFFKIPFAASIVFKTSTAYFDFFAYDPSGDRKCLAEGQIQIDPSTTQPDPT